MVSIGRPKDRKGVNSDTRETIVRRMAPRLASKRHPEPIIIASKRDCTPMLDSAHSTTPGRGNDKRAAQRQRGRPSILPEQRTPVFVTFVWIDSWRRTALLLAQRHAVSDAELEDILTRDVPPELRDNMRAVIGLHWRYRDAPGLTDAEQHRLGTLALELDSKPREQWTQEDRRKDGERAKLRVRLHGKAVIRQIEDPIKGIKGGTSAPHLGVLTMRVTPNYLCNLWLAFDTWGARRHGVAVKTFRDWRRALQQSDDLLFGWLRRERVPPLKPQRHRTQ